MELNSGSDLQSDINVTPLVDVVLVLLIIFMVIVPLTMRGYDVDIPGESSSVTVSAEPAKEQMVLAIEIDNCPVMQPPQGDGLPADCRVRVNDEVVQVTDLSDHVAEVFADRVGSDRVLFLAAEEDLNYEGVMRILGLARSGAEDLRIGFVTERKVAG
jgi:biopolymer transport protein TolR